MNPTRNEARPEEVPARSPAPKAFGPTDSRRLTPARWIARRPRIGWQTDPLPEAQSNRGSPSLGGRVRKQHRVAVSGVMVPVKVRLVTGLVSAAQSFWSPPGGLSGDGTRPKERTARPHREPLLQPQQSRGGCTRGLSHEIELVYGHAVTRRASRLDGSRGRGDGMAGRLQAQAPDRGPQVPEAVRDGRVDGPSEVVI